MTGGTMREPYAERPPASRGCALLAPPDYPPRVARIVIDARSAVDARRTGVGHYARALTHHLPRVDPETRYTAWYLDVRGIGSKPRKLAERGSTLQERATRIPTPDLRPGRIAAAAPPGRVAHRGLRSLPGDELRSSSHGIARCGARGPRSRVRGDARDRAAPPAALADAVRTVAGAGGGDHRAERRGPRRPARSARRGCREGDRDPPWHRRRRLAPRLPGRGRRRPPSVRDRRPLHPVRRRSRTPQEPRGVRSGPSDCSRTTASPSSWPGARSPGRRATAIGSRRRWPSSPRRCETGWSGPATCPMKIATHSCRAPRSSPTRRCSRGSGSPSSRGSPRTSPC